MVANGWRPGGGSNWVDQIGWIGVIVIAIVVAV